MAKREPVGVAFRFRVSFQAIAWLNALLVSGAGNTLAVVCVFRYALGWCCVCGKGVISF